MARTTKPVLDTTTGPADEETISQAGPADPQRESVQVVVQVDVFVERRDLGPGCYTRVAAGDPIPLGLRGLPYLPSVSLAAGRQKGGTR